MDPIRGYLQSPGGSRCAPYVIPVFYRKFFSKDGKTAMAREAWRHAIKNVYRNIARPFSAEFFANCVLLAACVYRYLLPSGRFPGGVYIFSDLERLSEERLARAIVVSEMLCGSKSAVRILNNPAHVLLRYDFLRKLNEEGVNDYNVYRPSQGQYPRTFPVFLRYENDHNGPLSPLIDNERDLADALRDLEERGELTDRLLIAEFRGTADENGIYRKYGAFVVGDRVFPKNINVSKNWITKTCCFSDPDLLEEEKDYVAADPHHDWLEKIFSLAKIDFGRIDYSMSNGNMVVWEINTNPVVSPSSRATRTGPREAVYDLVESRMSLALEALFENGGNKAG